MVYTLLFMMIIGAAIGGITNHLAIKMLFRPYQAIYIGKWKLPFTPGIIPRRRDELSVQLGDMVVKHLLTSDSIKKKLEEKEFKEKVTEWAKKEVRKIFESSITLREILEKYAKIENPEERFKEKTKQIIQKIYSDFMKEKGEKTIHELLPLSLHQVIKSKIPLLSELVINKGIEYIESEEAEEKLEIIVNQILEEKKMIRGFVQVFVGNGQLVNKVRKELVHILNKPATRESIEQIFEKEWFNLSSQTLNHYMKEMNQEKITELLEEKALKKIPIETWLDRKVSEWAAPYKEKIVEEFLPKGLEKTGVNVIKRVEEILEQFDLSNIVRKQVESFPIQRLEELILGIVSKEFKMITYLGAGLGGIIGLVQGLIVILTT